MQENGQNGPGDLGILSDIIHKMGAKAGVQIDHAGRQVG